MHKSKCPYCNKGVLHAGNYLRKPRGPNFDLPEEYLLRFSLCCSNEGCRKRYVPLSLRFFERKVYYTIFIVLISAMRFGPNRFRLNYLQKQFGVTERTIYRWHSFWKNEFTELKLYRLLEGYVNKVLSRDKLPVELIEIFSNNIGFNKNALITLLRHISPIPP